MAKADTTISPRLRISPEAQTASGDSAGDDSNSATDEVAASVLEEVLTEEPEKLSPKRLEEYVATERDLAEQTSLDIPLVRHGHIETVDAEALRVSFDEAWEDADWDGYDVRKKEAEYAFEHDDTLGAMDAVEKNTLLCRYYEGTDEEAMQPMNEALKRLEEENRHVRVLKSIEPDRKKLTSEFTLSLSEAGKWQIQRKKSEGIKQAVAKQDVRSIQRIYGEIPESVAATPAFRNYLENQVQIALSEDHSVRKLDIEVWYMSTTARPAQPGDNAPEGYHQDGYWLIDNQVIRRDPEITGGESIIYYRDTETGEIQKLYGAQLQPGEHMCMRDDDTPLYHDITPFYVNPVDVRIGGPKEFRRDILGSAITKLDDAGKPVSTSQETPLTTEQESHMPEYEQLIANSDEHLLTANTQQDYAALPSYQKALEAYQAASQIQGDHNLPHPKTVVKIVDEQSRKFALQELDQAVLKASNIIEIIEERGAFWQRTVRTAEVDADRHIPLMLALAEKYEHSYTLDERQFAVADPSGGDISFFEKRLAETLATAEGPMEFQTMEATIVPQLIRSLGRIPSPAEVLREHEWQAILRQVEKDRDDPGSRYQAEEIEPQQEVIQRRQRDFPQDPTEFERGAVRIEIITVQKDGIHKETRSLTTRQDGDHDHYTPEVKEETILFAEPEAQKYEGEEVGEKVTRLYIKTRNADDTDTVDHPVMTDEENGWVNGSAEMIARYVKGKNAKVFIAGLGLELLNKELERQGIDGKQQVVAEYNDNVIDLARTSEANLNLDVRQGDWQEVLRTAIDRGERFEAISIDAFPNSADEVNRDASSRKALQLAYEALKPGGVLTFYPDSQYIPARVLDILHEINIPDSSIHYTVEQFDKSQFTEQYHYGKLMSIPWIQRPLLEDEGKVADLQGEYMRNRSRQIAAYQDKHSQ